MSEQERQERIAVNEGRFRAINDRVRRDLAHLQLPEPILFVCECGRLDCREQIALTVEEYEVVRRDALQFAVRPGHEIPEAEDVVDRRDGVWIVRKHPNTRHVAEATDPRGGEPG